MISAGAVESRCSSPAETAATLRIADRQTVPALATAPKLSRQDRATGLHPAPVPAAIAVRVNRPAQRSRHPQPVRAAAAKLNRPRQGIGLHPARAVRGVTPPSETWGPAEPPAANLTADERASVAVALDVLLPVAAAAAWEEEDLEADAAAAGAAADGGPT